MLLRLALGGNTPLSDHRIATRPAAAPVRAPRPHNRHRAHPGRETPNTKEMKNMECRRRTRSRTMTRMQRRVATAVVLCQSFGIASVDAQQINTPTRQAWTIPTDSAIRALLAERLPHDGVGAVVGIVEPAGRRVVVYGESGAPDGRPLDDETVFQIGSVTKVFTGLLLADMVVRGEV